MTIFQNNGLNKKTAVWYHYVLFCKMRVEHYCRIYTIYNQYHYCRMLQV
jgi:hypothetical protein